MLQTKTLNDRSNILHHYRPKQRFAASFTFPASVAPMLWYVIQLPMSLVSDELVDSISEWPLGMHRVWNRFLTDIVGNTLRPSLFAFQKIPIHRIIDLLIRSYEGS